MAITGAVYFTGGFTLLLAGIYWRRASSAGAYAALGCGCLAIFGLKPLQHAVGLNVSSPILGLGCVGLAMLAMVVISLILPDRSPSQARKEQD